MVTLEKMRKVQAMNAKDPKAKVRLDRCASESTHINKKTSAFNKNNRSGPSNQNNRSGGCFVKIIIFHKHCGFVFQRSQNRLKSANRRTESPTHLFQLR